MGAKIQDNVLQVVAEKEKANSILRCMIEGVLVIDLKGQVLVINEQAKIMFNLPFDRDIQGASILELSRHPEMRKIIGDDLIFDLATARYSREVELHEGRWFRVNAVSLRNGLSSSYGSILVFHDITEIKRFERMRSDFVANVSHDCAPRLRQSAAMRKRFCKTRPTIRLTLNIFSALSRNMLNDSVASQKTC